MPIRRAFALLSVTLLLAVVSGCALLPRSGPIGYTRSGGFIGYADELVIQPDGSAVLTDRGTETRFEVPPATLVALDQAFAAAGFRDLPGSTIPPGSADMIETTFTWRGHTVGFAEGIPDALAPAALILSTIVEEHRPAR